MQRVNNSVIFSLSCVGGFGEMNGVYFFISLPDVGLVASLVAHTPLTWQGSPGKVDTEAGPAATLSLPRSDLSKSRVLVNTGE